MKTNTPHTTVEGDARTQDTREEWEREFEDKFSAFTFNNGGALELTLWDVVDERIHPTNEVGFEIYNFIHHQLQKARHDWLREEIVSFKKEMRNYPMVTEPEWRKGYTEALQDQINRYQAELDPDKK